MGTADDPEKIRIRIQIGKKLRQLREDARLSQTKLAKLAGMVQPMINRFETGEREIYVEHAQKLAPALGIAPIELLPPELTAEARRSGPAKTKAAADHIVQHAVFLES